MSSIFWKENDFMQLTTAVDYQCCCVVSADRQGGKPGAMQQCRSCRGTGIKVTMRQLGPGMVQQMQSTCNDCTGEGLMI